MSPPLQRGNARIFVASISMVAKSGPYARMRNRCAQLLLLGTALATTIGLLLTVAPAEAASRTVHDTAGDASARMDITRYTVSNTSKRIVAVIRVQDLRRT